VKASIGHFTCTVTGADTPTAVTLTFAPDWRH
jgi:hypothetical protein